LCKYLCHAQVNWAGCVDLLHYCIIALLYSYIAGDDALTPFSPTLLPFSQILNFTDPLRYAKKEQKKKGKVQRAKSAKC